MAAALAAWASRTGRATLGWATADAQPLAQSPLAPFLVNAGFVRSGPGFRFAGPTPGESRAQEPAQGRETDLPGPGDDDD